MCIADKLERAIKEHKDCTMSNNNTWVHWNTNTVSCKLWYTVVFTADLDSKQIVISDGGWNTPTTADRINTCFNSLGIHCCYSYAKGGVLVARATVTSTDYVPCYARNVFTEHGTYTVDGWSVTWK